MPESETWEENVYEAHGGAWPCSHGCPCECWAVPEDWVESLSVEEWAKSCTHGRPQHDSHCPFPHGACGCGGERLLASICINCADVYARQEVIKALKEVEKIARGLRMTKEGVSVDRASGNAIGAAIKTLIERKKL